MRCQVDSAGATDTGVADARFADWALLQISVDALRTGMEAKVPTRRDGEVSG